MTERCVLWLLPVLLIGDPTVEINKSLYKAYDGTRVTLECIVTPDPKYYIEYVFWRKKVLNKLTTIRRGNGIDGMTKDNPSLIITSTKVEDSGQYICYATDAQKTVASPPIILTVSADPIINIEVEKYEVKYGDPVTLRCSIQPNMKYPVRKVYWQLINNGVVITIESDTKGISGNSINNPSLTINHVTSSEAGQYTFFATNDMGTTRSNSIDVGVIGDLPTVEIEQKKYASVYGEDITLKCNITAVPAITDVYWERVQNGTKMIINKGSVGVEGITPENPSLTLIFTTKMNIGKYRCFATNEVGTHGSEFTSLDVTGGKPKVTTTSSVVTANFGNEVTLACIVNATPTQNRIYWYKKVNDLNHITFINDGFPGMSGSTVESPSLIIKHATPANDGNYSCFAENAVGITESKPVKLIVRAAIPEVIVPRKTLIEKAGINVTLNCNIKAFPPVTEVYWERHINKSITIIKQHSLQVEGSTVSNPSLTIRTASVSMSGKYTCLARNPVGTERSLETVLKIVESLSDIIDNDTEDQTETIYNGIYGGIGAVVAVATAVIGYRVYKERQEN
ncbi:unnamed protein product [Mytilus coruscus]|uniref:Ig-like domain-containing protein n=1 Tax=Mytilus coruscus TaxID=42192 RepID=A0A6J8C1B0_MYTCO|nr:unnamed protein product [Mytilus coruscus]